MRSKLFVAVLVTLAFILDTVPLSFAEPSDASALLTQARLSSSSFVYGFKDQSKTVAKTLALEVVPKF